MAKALAPVAALPCKWHYACNMPTVHGFMPQGKKEEGGGGRRRRRMSGGGGRRQRRRKEEEGGMMEEEMGMGK